MSQKEGFAEQLKAQGEVWQAQLADYQQKLELAGETARGKVGREDAGSLCVLFVTNGERRAHVLFMNDRTRSNSACLISRNPSSLSVTRTFVCTVSPCSRADIDWPSNDLRSRRQFTGRSE
jgi:hypothetical protein